MKILISSIALFFSTIAIAGPHHHHRHFYHHRHYSPPVVHWVAPAIIGGAVTYALTKPQPYTEIIVEQPVVQCTEWREVQQQDGSIVRERFCSQR